MEDQLSLPSLRLTVDPESLSLFTTALQSGIEIKANRGETLAGFLNRFPGFTAEYLADTVQTIFLDGTAIDDLSLPLTGNTPTLALSAAMPGLAGAIFRKNSFHSALRTETKNLQAASGQDDTVSVTLKLFNSIAKERGEELLKTGFCMKSDQLTTFLGKRPHLIEHIVKIQLAEKELNHGELFRALDELAKINLIIIGTDG